MLKPDLSAASLHAINTSELIPHDILDYVTFHRYMICEDAFVSCWIYEGPVGVRPHKYHVGVYTELTSARSANFGGLVAKILPDIGHECHLFSCPASGRFVRLNRNNSVVVLDFF
jgi:hypothetical protein